MKPPAQARSSTERRESPPAMASVAGRERDSSSHPFPSRNAGSSAQTRIETPAIFPPRRVPVKARLESTLYVDCWKYRLQQCVRMGALIQTLVARCTQLAQSFKGAIGVSARASQQP